MKTGKQIKITNQNDYKISFGSVNNKNPKAVYLNISSWIEPLKDEEVDYNKVIKDLNKKLRQTIFNHLFNQTKTDFNKDATIVDLDIRESGIKYGKRSFMNCEITLYLDVESLSNSEKMKNNFNDLIPIILKKVFEDHEYFKFHKKKI